MSAAEFLKKYQKKPVVQSNNNNTTTTAAVVSSPSAAVEPTLSSLVAQCTLLGTYNKTLLTINKTPTSAPLKVDFSMGIGCDCASAAALRFAKLRPCSLPLDWIRSTPESTRRMLMLHEEYPIDATTTTNPSTLIEEEVVESKASSLGARRRYFKAFHPRELNNAAAANSNHIKEEDEESIVGCDDEGPDPLMAPCDSDADDDDGVSIVSKMAHKVAASPSNSSSTDAGGISWTLSCPLFEGLEAAVKVARLRNTMRGEVSVACDTLPVYHRLDTQQYFTAPLDNSGTTTSAVTTNSNTISTPSGLQEPHHEAFYFDRNFGLIASREEAMNAQRRMVRVHWALREIRKQINEQQQVDDTLPPNQQQQQPMRILLLCTGRVVGDCPEITARINGGHLVMSPFKSKEGSENTQLCQEALSVAEAVLTIVSPRITSDNMKTCSGQQRRPLDVHLVLVNVGMEEESIRLENCDTTSVADGRQNHHQPTTTVHIHKRFVGYPSAAKPWANVGALTSEVLTDMYRL